VLAATLLTAAGLTACTVTVDGEAVPADRPPGINVDILAAGESVDIDSDPGATNDFWDDNASNASAPEYEPPPEGEEALTDTPTGVLVDPTTGPVEAVDPESLQDSSAGNPFAAPGLSGQVHGRLYGAFDDQTAYVCSATVVTSAGKNMVATAAHCVYDAFGKRYAQKLQFVPADRNQMEETPYGIWYANKIFAPTEFIEQAEADASGRTAGNGWYYDFAFLSMDPNEDGQQIQDVTGGQGISFGGELDGVLSIGYPAAPPFDGLSQRYCSASNVADRYTNDYVLNCDMTGGCSGGAWLTKFDSTTGAGYLIGSNSRGGGGQMLSAALGEVALALYNQAGGGA
jgi:V8-like Glu-specific endopeptidase